MIIGGIGGGVAGLDPNATVASPDMSGPAPMSTNSVLTGTPQQSTGLFAKIGRANSGGNVMGMSPDQFSQLAGGMAGAISKKGSWQSALGSLAAGMGQSHMQALAADAQKKGMLANIQEAMKKDPNFLASIIGQYDSTGTAKSAAPVSPVATVEGNPQVGG
jgi:hypothetical protein